MTTGIVICAFARAGKDFVSFPLLKMLLHTHIVVVVVVAAAAAQANVFVVFGLDGKKIRARLTRVAVRTALSRQSPPRVDVRL